MMNQLAYVHVKWFSEFSFRDRPLGLAEAITPAFLALALLSTLTIGGLVFLDGHSRALPHTSGSTSGCRAAAMTAYL